MTYLDHAATTPLLPEVLAAMTEQLGRVGNASSLHASGRAARPLACSDEALPTRPSCSVIAARTSGSSGVVAAWSR